MPCTASSKHTKNIHPPKKNVLTKLALCRNIVLQTVNNGAKCCLIQALAAHINMEEKQKKNCLPNYSFIFHTM